MYDVLYSTTLPAISLTRPKNIKDIKSKISVIITWLLPTDISSHSITNSWVKRDPHIIVIKSNLKQINPPPNKALDNENLFIIMSYVFTVLEHNMVSSYKKVFTL